jgi:hypothetical protein
MKNNERNSILVTFPSGTLFNCTKQNQLIPDHVTAAQKYGCLRTY